MLSTALVVFALASIVSIVAVARSKQPLPIAAGCLVGVSTFVPLVIAPSELVATYIAFASLMATVALARSRRVVGSWVRPSRLAAFAIAAVLYLQLVRVAGGQASVREWALTLGSIAVIVLASRFRREDIKGLAAILVPFLVFHLVYAGLELVPGIPPLWPMGNGLSELTHRPNFLIDALPGRPMSSFAHPIPLATFAATCVVIFGFVASHFRARLYWLWSALGGMLVVLSGTRSAVLAIAFGLAVLALSSKKVGGAFKVNVLAAVGVVAGLMTLFPSTREVFGLGDAFEGSLSYTYRVTILESAANAFNQPIANILFGWGGDRAEVSRLGIVPNADYGVLFFDNQYVALFILYGIVGFVLALGVAFGAAMRARSSWRAVLAVFAVMAFSFDFLQYLTPTLCFFLAVWGSARHSADRESMGRNRDMVLPLRWRSFL